MAETTGISWCDDSAPQALAPLSLALVANAVRFEMAQFMARMAQRHAVVDVVRQIRPLGERLLVMRPKVAAAIIAAIPAAISITLENGSAPRDVLRATTQIQIALTLPVAVSVVAGPAGCALFRNGRNLRYRFRGVLFPEAVRWTAFGSLAHCQLGSLGVPFSSEGARPPAPINADLDAGTAPRLAGEPVAARRVPIELSDRLPFMAAAASLQASGAARAIFVHGQSGRSSSKFQRALWSLRHG